MLDLQFEISHFKNQLGGIDSDEDYDKEIDKLNMLMENMNQKIEIVQEKEKKIWRKQQTLELFDNQLIKNSEVQRIKEYMERYRMKCEELEQKNYQLQIKLQSNEQGLQQNDGDILKKEQSQQDLQQQSYYGNLQQYRAQTFSVKQNKNQSKDTHKKFEEIMETQESQDIYQDFNIQSHKKEFNVQEFKFEKNQQNINSLDLNIQQNQLNQGDKNNQDIQIQSETKLADSLQNENLIENQILDLSNQVNNQEDQEKIELVKYQLENQQLNQENNEMRNDILMLVSEFQALQIQKEQQQYDNQLEVQKYQKIIKNQESYIGTAEKSIQNWKYNYNMKLCNIIAKSKEKDQKIRQLKQEIQRINNLLEKNGIQQQNLQENSVNNENINIQNGIQDFNNDTQSTKDTQYNQDEKKQQNKLQIEQQDSNKNVFQNEQLGQENNITENNKKRE
ncbi:hypothetical protein PPERSA_11124 [Pseudocohnilembus persalinus]|uniref:Uncharacterized protein n=1 Tax=Pseudocohnilembus persalinus TaxID=266149 RepID=A0A0V0QZ45_PSEPJ|nr:hypothetical protein PPERSA_11124 [Pseudocohnilembus persalinus]|eukprot:KRX07575.1 hypothetical protein PPERSA_11124 [Pseudocohnilembus persalinus]